MYISFTNSEARAIMSVVIDMVCVDGKIHKNEEWLVNQLCKKFGFGNSDIKLAQNMQPGEVVPVISGMSWEKRKLVSYILATAAAIDGYVDQNESATYYFISQHCNLITSEIDNDVAMKAVKDFLG